MFTFWFVRKPADLQDLAPGTNPPFMTFNSEVKVDVNKIEEFLEERLTPPRYTNIFMFICSYIFKNVLDISDDIQP